ADTAGQFDGDVQRADDLGEQLTVAAAAECGVEVHEMDPLGAVALPGHRGVQRGPVVGFAACLSLDKPHGLAVDDVDSGQKNQWHGRQPSVLTGPIPNCPATSHLRRRSSPGGTALPTMLRPRQRRETAPYALPRS